VPYFLKIEGVVGSSLDAKHKDEIEVESFSWGLAHTTAPSTGGGGATAGRPTFEGLSVVTRFGRAGPRLFQACATGERLRSAVLTGGRGAGKAQFEYITLTLSDVLVSSYQSGAPSAEVTPSDQFSLTFSKLKIEHKGQKADGSPGDSTAAGFDIQANTKF
jgi:type VI secretion system secreted protein Hcp